MNKEIEFEVPNTLEGVKNMDNPFFPSHFLCLLCGWPGSGKSTLLKFILKNEQLLYKKYNEVLKILNQILILSPSFKDFDSLFLPPSNLHYEYNLEFVDKHIERINKLKGYQNVLIVFDDLIGSIHKNMKDPKLLALIFNRRHLLNNGMISIIMTSKFNY